MPVLGVWVGDQSRKSRTANAAVTGLGRTRRIILFDTLLRELTEDEIEAVLAHELAHHAHADIWRGLAVHGVVTLATFWLADRVLAVGVARLGLAGPADLAGLPLLGLILLAAGLLAMPLTNGWSRRVERQADDFAVRLLGARGRLRGGHGEAGRAQSRRAVSPPPGGDPALLPPGHRAPGGPGTGPGGAVDGVTVYRATRSYPRRGLR